MKIFVTDRALTVGIRQLEAEVKDGMALVRHDTGCTEYFHGRDWHANQISANEQAEKMRLDKLKSLQKSIDRLKKLVF